LFSPGDVETVVKQDAPEEYYRNRFLATAMFNLKMVDTAGGGIRKMFNFQRERFFPMPEYDLSNKRVKVTIIGKVLDMDFARILANNADLSLDEIIMLDKVQKNKVISDLEAKQLKAKKLIEGRKPNYFLSIKIAQSAGQKAEYSRNRAFEKQYYFDLIRKAIGEHGYLTRKEIDELLWNKLSDVMDDMQKRYKVGNLLGELRKQGVIYNKGSMKNSLWVLVKKSE
jgi:ATP-dependent DNA helicase RecG